MATKSNTRSGRRFAQRGVVMKFVMNMVRKPFKAGDVIFNFGEKSDDLYLIHSGSVEIVSCEGLVLATLNAGELFGEMASILGERERATRAVTATKRITTATPKCAPECRLWVFLPTISVNWYPCRDSA